MLPSGSAFLINLAEVDATILGKRKSNLAAWLNAKHIADPLWNSHLTLGRDFHRHCIPQKKPNQNCSLHSVPMIRLSTKFMEITMHQTQHWQPATLAAALGVPEEAFRAFARLRQIAWEKELSPPEAASLALAWVAADRAACHGAIAEAAGALPDAVTEAPAA